MDVNASVVSVIISHCQAGAVAYNKYEKATKNVKNAIMFFLPYRSATYPPIIATIAYTDV